MSIDKDPAVFKLLVGILGTVVVGVGSFLVTMLFQFKSTYNKTIENIYSRLNKTDEKVTTITTRCEERYKNGKKS